MLNVEWFQNPKGKWIGTLGLNQAVVERTSDGWVMRARIDGVITEPSEHFAVWGARTAAEVLLRDALGLDTRPLELAYGPLKEAA